MPSKPLLTKVQWKKVRTDYVYAGMTTPELATKYAVSIGAVKAHCWRDHWALARKRFEVASEKPGVSVPFDQPDDQPPATQEDKEHKALIATRHAEDDKTDLPVLLPVKREEFLRATIRTADILMEKIEKRAGVIDLSNDARMKSLVRLLADLVDIIKGPLALEADKPEPQKQMAVQVNILNQVLEEADKAAGRQGMRPTEEKTIEL